MATAVHISSALLYLEEKKDILKKDIQNLLGSENERIRWIGDELSKNLDKIIYDLWINKYGNTTTNNSSDRAYELNNFFNS